MKRLACIILILTVLVSGLFIVRNVHGQTVVSGTITSDTEWTTAESPINFDGTVTVNQNVNLTIDPGVAVNFGIYPFLIDGTLTAQGTANNQIVFSSSSGNTSLPYGTAASMILAQASQAFGTTANSGSIIQNAVFDGISVSVAAGSPEIDTCVFNFATPYGSPINLSGGSPTISNNIINYNLPGPSSPTTTIYVFGGNPSIINNQFEGSFSGSANIGVNLISGAPVITGNSFTAQYGNNSVGIKVTAGAPQITNNQFQGNGYLTGVFDSSSSSFTVSDNTFTDCTSGITAQGNTILTVEGNQILKGYDGIDIADGATLTITDNLIDSNSHFGINGGGNINSNTITNNEVGIHNPPTGPINNNNIVGNTENSIQATIENVDAQNNWWGTTDTATINQTIYDSKVDYHLGTVFFVPFLTQPSSSAPPIPAYTSTVIPISTSNPTMPAPTPEPVTTPTPAPDQYRQSFVYQVGTILNLNLITTATAVILALVRVIVILGYAAKRGISKFKSKT